MTKTVRKYDLEDRTLKFSKKVRQFTRDIKKNIDLQNDTLQLIRSSGSVGANYIEANDSLSKKDFLMRIRICLKEVKEAEYWLRLIYDALPDNNNESTIHLIQEAEELRHIFAKIIINTVAKYNSE